MITLSMAEIAGLVGGRLHGVHPDTLVHGKVEFDSRRVSPGDLFLAVAGEHTDGHAYAESAVAAGALAVIGTRELDQPTIVVDDPIAAITALATAVSTRLRAKIVAVTGSSGKTSTKDLIAQVLAGHGVTVSAPESFNNELGYPYTVLLADESTDYLVLEASSRGIGHIAHLTEIAAPSVAAVLNVGTAHLAEFGSVANIAQAKGELIEALPADGVAILNADDPVVLAMAGRTRGRVSTFGEHASADVRADKVVIDSAGCAGFDLVHGSDRFAVRLQVRGEHQVGNALAAAAVAIAFGMTPSDIAAALSDAVVKSHWRMEVTETAAGVTVVNDAYNANPESMRAALKTLAILSEGRRGVAVLGEMAELGADSIAQHDRVGRLIVRLNVEALIAVGEQARPIANGAALEGSWNGESEWVPDVPAAIERLDAVVRPGDVVLIKGSRSVAMERVATAIIARLDDPARTR